MAFILLHCNICPKEPDFSDLSHLLTHIASKGHLSQVFRAQVQARGDENARDKVSVYEHWYNRYEIEKLLSERMDAKQAKLDPHAKTSSRKSTSVSCGNSQKPRGRRQKRKALKRKSDRSSPVKEEDTIDPLLSTADLPHLPRDLEESPTYAVASRRWAPIPHMHDWQLETPQHGRRSSSPPRTPHLGTSRYDHFIDFDDHENDYMRAFVKSPSDKGYPDPPENPFLPQQPQRSNRGSLIQSEVNNSPVLKGVVFPGMSLFDAASREAQRLRNQKKNGSVLAQMEIDAAAIEPLEQIWWPQGRLKKERIITGNVESSPLKEPTPAKQSRPSRIRKPLNEISTNVKQLGKKRGRPVSADFSVDATGLENMADTALQTLRTVYPRNAHMEYDPSEHLNVALPPRRKKRANTRNTGGFSIHRDLPELEKSANSNRPLTDDQKTAPLFTSSHSKLGTAFHHQMMPQLRSSSPLLGSNVNSLTTEPLHLNRMTGDQSYPRQVVVSDKENIPPAFHRDSKVTNEPTEEHSHRVTQRYFSMGANQVPQFFNSLPPQMEFGGDAGPPFYGAFVNPLNVYHPARHEHMGFSPSRYRQVSSIGISKTNSMPSVPFDKSEPAAL